MSYWSITDTHGLGERVADRRGPDFEIVFLQDRIAGALSREYGSGA